MIRSLVALQSYLAAAVVATTIAGLGIDLARTAYSAAHTAETIVLVPNT